MNLWRTASCMSARNSFTLYHNIILDSADLLSCLWSYITTIAWRKTNAYCSDIDRKMQLYSIIGIINIDLQEDLSIRYKKQHFRKRLSLRDSRILTLVQQASEDRAGSEWATEEPINGLFPGWVDVVGKFWLSVTSCLDKGKKNEALLYMVA